MHVREINILQDYPRLKSWWEKRGLPYPSPEFLPPTGGLVSDRGLDLCAGFLFRTDAKIAIINHVVSDPTPLNKTIRDQALDDLISYLIWKAKEGEFKLLTAACNVDRLGERYKKHGFFVTDSDEIHFGRTI